MRAERSWRVCPPVSARKLVLLDFQSGGLVLTRVQGDLRRSPPPRRWCRRRQPGVASADGSGRQRPPSVRRCSPSASGRRGARRPRRRRPGPDDLRLAGRRGQPRVRAAAGPRAPGPRRAAPRRVDAALARLDAGTYGAVRVVRQADPRRSGSRPCRGPRCASTASGAYATDDGRGGGSAEGEVTEELVGLDDIRAAAGACGASRCARRSSRSGRATAASGSRPSRCSRSARSRSRGAYVAASLAAAGGARARADHLLQRQPRPGRRPGGAAARRAGGRS